MKPPDQNPFYQTCKVEEKNSRFSFIIINRPIYREKYEKFCVFTIEIWSELNQDLDPWQKKIRIRLGKHLKTFSPQISCPQEKERSPTRISIFSVSIRVIYLFIIKLVGHPTSTDNGIRFHESVEITFLHKNIIFFWFMVLIKDGSPEHIAHVWNKIGLFWKKKIGFDNSLDVT